MEVINSITPITSNTANTTQDFEMEEINAYRESLISNVWEEGKIRFNALMDKWEDIGIPQEKWQERTSFVKTPIVELFDAMLSEEDGYKELLLKKIEGFGSEGTKLEKELGMANYIPNSEKSLPLMTELESYVIKLREKKKEHMDKLFDLQREENLLCRQLSFPLLNISNLVVPTEAQIKDLKQHIDYMETELKTRQSTFATHKATAVSILDELEIPPTTFMHDVICEAEESFLFSDENMEKLQKAVIALQDDLECRKKRADHLRQEIRVLWDRLDIPDNHREVNFVDFEGHKLSAIEKLEEEFSHLKALKDENLVVFVGRVREEIEELWNQCHYGQVQRDEFIQYTSTDFTEELLVSHEDEVKKLKVWYEDHRELIRLVEKHSELFQKMVSFENSSHDPSRLFANRGGALLQEEKKRQRITKELPKVENELRSMINQLELTTGEPFLFDGQCILSFLKEQWNQFEEDKENEKRKRQEAKQKQLETEARLGSHSSATKRKIAVTPNTTSKKVRNMPITPAASVIMRSPTSSKKSVKVTPRLTKKASRKSLRLRHASRLNVTSDTGTSTSYSDFTHQLHQQSQLDILRSSIIVEPPKFCFTPPTPLRKLTSDYGRSFRAATDVSMKPPPARTTTPRNTRGISTTLGKSTMTRSTPTLNRTGSARSKLTTPVKQKPFVV